MYIWSKLQLRVKTETEKYLSVDRPRSTLNSFGLVVDRNRVDVVVESDLLQGNLSKSSLLICNQMTRFLSCTLSFLNPTVHKVSLSELKRWWFSGLKFTYIFSVVYSQLQQNQPL